MNKPPSLIGHFHSPNPPGATRRLPAIRPGIMPAMVFLCGVTICIKLDVVGEIFLLEPLLLFLSLQCLIARGPGNGFVGPVFLGFVAAGLVTFCGYLLADLVAANEPWQYLKGWGRVILLVVDSAALMLLVAQDRQNVWWLALGVGVGGFGSLLFEGLPLTQWKLGYGEYAAILVLALAPLVTARLAMFIVGGFGVACLVADYRSLGAVCIAVCAIIFWRPETGNMARGLWKKIGIALVGIVAVLCLLAYTQEQYAERRQQSNVGRYVGLLVAWRAISESPLLGYGSWAADEKYVRMLHSEAARLSDGSDGHLDVGRSLLPHSQLLQVWIEGGLPGMAFFVAYGWGLLAALRWFAWRKPPDPLSPLFLFLLLSGIWNLVGSPFLGIHRIYIAMAVASIAVAAHESRRVAAADSR